MTTETKERHSVLDAEFLQRVALSQTRECFTLSRASASVLAGEYLLLRSTLSDALDVMERLSPNYCAANDVEQTTDEELDDVMGGMKELLK